MANKPQLNPNVLDYLHNRLGKPIITIRSEISRLRREFPKSTLNAVAQIYAEQHRESVRRLISKEDKSTIPSVTFEKPRVVKRKKQGGKKEEFIEIIHFKTADHFLIKHIEEINRAYNKKCYTCVFVLTRKVFENLIIGILKAKFSSDRDLYFDISKRRHQDFSVALDNLYRKRNDFDADKKEVIERLNQKLKPFKNDANDKVHSLFHVVENRGEVDDWNIDTILALLSRVL